MHIRRNLLLNFSLYRRFTYRFVQNKLFGSWTNKASNLLTSLHFLFFSSLIISQTHFTAKYTAHRILYTSALLGIFSSCEHVFTCLSHNSPQTHSIIAPRLCVCYWYTLQYSQGARESLSPLILINQIRKRGTSRSKLVTSKPSVTSSSENKNNSAYLSIPQRTIMLKHVSQRRWGFVPYGSPQLK